jgi:hypothetical protein
MATKKSAKRTATKKKAATKKTTVIAPGKLANGSQPRAAGSEDWNVRIRMYRKWLGDCFLLTFSSGGSKTHIMIDCGALSGTPEGKQKIAQAVEDIIKETDGKLAALVVTHEHWDHVSGFSDAVDSFKKFSSIGEVWAAWTEDPTQTIAQEKKTQNQLRFDAVQSALRSWNASGRESDQERGSAVAALMDFMPPGGLAAFSVNTDTAMNNALSLGKQRLLSPGDTVEVEQVPGLRVHVLGPPKDTKSLHTMMGKIGKDMYGLTLGSSQIATTEAFAAAAASQTGSPSPDRYVPFEPYLHWDEAAWSKQWNDLATDYNAEPLRKIDRDWLNSAAELALQLDSYTNNTSLVLAFELPVSKDVLLFVGDAQVGNWQSWANVKFGDTNINAADLLARTVFYKVGHHGSHNATLKEGGLEGMTSPNLVAAIPVDESFARNSKHWDMPAGPLLASLLEKTASRVLREDSDFPKNSAKPEQFPETKWKEFQQNTNVQEQFIEYYVR